MLLNVSEHAMNIFNLLIGYIRRAGYTTWKEWTEATYTNWLFSINLGDSEMLEDPGEDENIKNTLNFNGTGLKT